MNVETRHVKYAFADVVEFTVNRTVEAQVEIVAALSDAFRTAAEGLETIFLPTGDDRVISADFRLEMIRQRGMLLRRYLREWIGSEDDTQE